MELHEIRYFLALSRTRNFTRAAESCHVSQPALTRAIRKMEAELGGPLVVRERNNIHLTELGRMVEPHLTETLARAQAAKEAAVRLLRPGKTRVRLGVMNTLGPARFVKFLARFRADYPGTDVALTEAVPDRLCDLLTNGEVDATLMAGPDGLAPRLQAQPLYRERFVIACAEGHPIARRSAVRVAELDGQVYLSPGGCDYRDLLEDACAQQGARLVRSACIEREAWILTMVAAGLGICLLPEYPTAFPGVVSRPVIDPPIERAVCLVTALERPWSSSLRAFAQASRQYRWAEAEARVA